MIEGQRAGREGGEGGTDVLGPGRHPRRKERLHGSPGLQHLAEQEEQAGHVAPVAPAVLEGGEPPRSLAGLEAAHRPGGTGAQRLEHGRDAALDRGHVPEGEGGGHHAHHLAVLVLGLGPHELQGVRVHETLVVLAVQGVEALLQLVLAHSRF